MSGNFVVKRRHKNVRMTSVLFKMANAKVGYLKVKLNLLKESNMRLWIGQTNLSLGSLFGITRQSLVMLSSDPQDRIVYPIHKLMIDYYILTIPWLKLKSSKVKKGAQISILIHV